MWFGTACFLLTTLVAAEGIKFQDDQFQDNSQIERILDELEKANEIQREATKELKLAQVEMEATKLLIERNLKSKSEVSKQFNVISDQLKRMAQECRTNVPQVRGDDSECRFSRSEIREKKNFLETRNGIYFLTFALKWKDALDWCKSNRMELAMIKTTEEVKYVSDALEANTQNEMVWVGASDTGRTNGDFRWTDETKVDDALWREGYPKSGGDQTCIICEGAQKALSNTKCDRKLIALCRVPRKMICQ